MIWANICPACYDKHMRLNYEYDKLWLERGEWWVTA